MIDIIQNMDNAVLQFIQINLRSYIMDKIAPIITLLGSGITIWGIIAILLLISKKYRKYGFMIIISLILCFIVGNLSLKPLVARTRPFNAVPLLDTLLVKPPKDFSFPSGHTMCSFASATVIFYMNKKLGIFMLILSAFIGFTRLYLYVHYPSDVFCGMTIGILLGLATISLFNNMKNKTIKY